MAYWWPISSSHSMVMSRASVFYFVFLTVSWKSSKFTEKSCRRMDEWVYAII